MTRYWFGGGVADWTFTTQDGVGGFDDIAQVVPGVTVTAWNAETGGTQHLDLLDEAGAAVTFVTSADGTTGRAAGTIPPFRGPDGVTELWAQAGGGPRALLVARLGTQVQDTTALAEQTAANLTAHVSAPNPHAMSTTDLTDYSGGTPLDGQVPVYRTTSGQYEPTTVEGLDAADFVSAFGGSEIVIPVGDTTTRALGVRLPPGDRTGAVDGVTVWWNSGTEGSPVWTPVTRFGPYGELRSRAPKADVVAAEVAAAAGQTADLHRWTDSSGNPLARVDAAGRVRAPNVGITPTWNQDTGATGVGTYRFYNPTGGPLVLRGFVVSAGGTAPAGGDYIVNPKLDGTAVYTSGNRPRITAGNRTSGVVTNLSTTVWPAGSYLTVDVDSVPSTAPTKVTIQALAY